MANAASITIDTAPASGGVYTSTSVSLLTLGYAATGDSAVPSATAQCRVVVVGATTQTVDWTACSAAPFNHTSGPFAPGNRRDWLGSGFGLAKGIEGEWTFSVRQTIDGVEQSASRSWAVDDTPPTIDLEAVQSPVNDFSPALPFTIGDAHPGYSFCGVNQSFSVAPDYVACTGTYTPSTPLADGNYYFWVNSTDATGEFSNSSVSSKAFTIDTVAPTVAIDPPTSPTADDTPSIAFSFSGDNGSPPSCRYYLTGSTPSAWGSCTSNSGLDLPPLADGSWTIEVRVSDSAGNFGMDSTLIIVDAVPPVVVTPDQPSETSVVPPPTPGVATGAKFNRSSGKLKGSKYRFVLKSTVALPNGANTSALCAGQAKLTVTAKLKGKKAKGFSKSATLKPATGGCTATANFSLPKTYKGKAASAKISFSGGASLSKFDLTGKISKL